MKYLFINTRNEFYRFETASLAYFEADGNYTSFQLRNQKRGTVTMTLARIRRERQNGQPALQGAQAEQEVPLLRLPVKAIR